MRPILILAVLAPFLALSLVACSNRTDRPVLPEVRRDGTSDSQAPSPPATTQPAPTNTPPAASRNLGPAEHEGRRTLEHIRVLSVDIGPRVAGTAREREAAGYIQRQFEASGFTVEIMSAPAGDSNARDNAVSVGGRGLSGVDLQGSNPVAASGKAVYVGLADTAGIAGRSLSGAIAVADRGTLNFVDKYKNVRRAGAVGLVVVNNLPGLYTGNLVESAEIPVIGVAQEDGPVLQEAAARGETIRISAPLSSNVIARPRADATCRIVVGGHFDSVPGAPGANDNASGTAHVIELARAFASDGLDDGLCFATFGAEETGLNGSKALAERLKAERKLPRFMVNLDVTAIGDEVEIIGDSALVQRSLSIAERLRIPARQSSLPANTGSDHQSFAAAGVPVIFFTSGNFATIHTPGDVITGLQADEVERVGDLAYATIADLLKQVAAG